jgi:DNA-binding transcriptional MerR regulator
LGISAKTLIRWTDNGLIRCERGPDFGSRRLYARAELARVRRSMTI